LASLSDEAQSSNVASIDALTERSTHQGECSESVRQAECNCNAKVNPVGDY